MNKHLQQLLDAINAKNLEKQGIITKALDAGNTPNEEEDKRIADIDAEIAQLQKTFDNLKATLDATAKAAATATPVAGQSAEEAMKSAQGDPNPATPKIEVASNLEKGIGFALMVKASAVAAHSKGQVTAIDVLKAWNAPEQVQSALQQKAVIGTTTDPNFASALVDYQNLTGEFIELLRGKTVVDRLASRMRQVPFNIKMPSQTGASAVNWVGETKTKPVTNPTFGSMTLSKSKIAGIVLLSDELVRFSNPKADTLVRDDLVKSTAEFIDDQFFDPDKAESDDSPASVLNGVAATPSTGETAEAYEADLFALLQSLTDQGISISGATWVMSETRAAKLSMMRDALGRKYFEGMNLQGQSYLMTLPVEISAAAEDKIALVLPSEILLADDGSMDFSVSSEATINLGTDAAPNWINLYQNNLMAIRGERFIRWKKRRAQAAGYIQYA
ncbi:phage major capsid protein [Acinetobacter sp. USHLN143]|uniref:phage major capsid protein n=1 Tax=Acinetobacter sp. USHLN143 TaxID=3081679 RepID=UPI0030165809